MITADAHVQNILFLVDYNGNIHVSEKRKKREKNEKS